MGGGGGKGGEVHDVAARGSRSVRSWKGRVGAGRVA